MRPGLKSVTGAAFTDGADVITMEKTTAIAATTRKNLRLD